MCDYIYILSFLYNSTTASSGLVIRAISEYKSNKRRTFSTKRPNQHFVQFNGYRKPHNNRQSTKCPTNNNNNSILYSALFNFNRSKALYIEILIKTYSELT